MIGWAQRAGTRSAPGPEGEAIMAIITKLNGMTREEIAAALRIERRKATTEIAALRKEIRERQQQIEALESRLRMIDESEGLL